MMEEGIMGLKIADRWVRSSAPEGRKRWVCTVLSRTGCYSNKLPDNIESLIKYANEVLSGERWNGK